MSPLLRQGHPPGIKVQMVRKIYRFPLDIPPYGRCILKAQPSRAPRQPPGAGKETEHETKNSNNPSLGAGPGPKPEPCRPRFGGGGSEGVHGGDHRREGRFLRNGIRPGHAGQLGRVAGRGDHLLRFPQGGTGHKRRAQGGRGRRLLHRFRQQDVHHRGRHAAGGGGKAESGSARGQISAGVQNGGPPL